MFLMLFAFAGVTTMAVTGCSKDPMDDLSSEDSRVYTTYRDTAVQFSSYATFKIADSVSVVVDGTQEAKDLQPIDSAYIASVKKYLTAAGYQESTGSATADLGVNVNILINHSNVYYSYGAYWGGYGGFWDPGFYWGYPGYGYGYPTFVQSVTVSDAGVSVNILDLKNAAANGNKLDLIWLGLINGAGVLNNSNIGIADGQVKALFDQSTYLKK